MRGGDCGDCAAGLTEAAATGPGEGVGAWEAM